MVIVDTWKEIGEYIADGSYTERYSIGDIKWLNIELDGRKTIIEMQIAAFDEDILFDTGEKAPITWISKRSIAVRAMNSTETNQGGWMLSDMRKYCMSLYDDILDKDARALIKPVRKTSHHYETKSSHTTKDLCWIPSQSEVMNQEYGDETGPKYTALFGQAETRKKYDLANNLIWWWLRSADIECENAFRNIHGDGYDYSGPANATTATLLPTISRGVVLGFCTSI